MENNMKRRQINTFNHNICHFPSRINLFCLILILNQGLVLLLSRPNTQLSIITHYSFICAAIEHKMANFGDRS